MLCKKPFLKGKLAFGCGQCMHCRVNRRRIWSHRIVLESYCHEHASFVTLTYSPENLPEGGTLIPRDLTLFLKRLRKEIEPVQIRYFAVGEYGELSERPHYHLALYGIPMTEGDMISRCWGLGNIHMGQVTPHSASYIAGYVTKKLTQRDDERLNGRHPEFARMSLKPGIGAKAIDAIASTLMSKEGSKYLGRTGDVPQDVLVGGKPQPLGRYLREKLREAIGFDEKTTPPESLQTYIAQMQALSDEVGEVNFKTAYPFVDWARAYRNEEKAKLFRKARPL